MNLNHPDFLLWMLLYYPSSTLAELLQHRAGRRSYSSYPPWAQGWASGLSLTLWGLVGWWLW